MSGRRRTAAGFAIGGTQLNLRTAFPRNLRDRERYRHRLVTTRNILLEDALRELLTMQERLGRGQAVSEFERRRVMRRARDLVGSKARRRLRAPVKCKRGWRGSGTS